MQTTKRKVLFNLFRLSGPAAPYLRRLTEADLDVAVNPHERLYTEEEMIAAVPGVFATIAAGEPYTERVFRAAKDLRVVARWGVGYNEIDVEAATRHGVLVAMAFGTNHEAVADGTLALMAALAENIVPHHFRVKGGGWGFEAHPGLWRATVGIVGLGRIGKAVARRCQGFEMQVLAHDTVQDRSFAEAHDITFVSLEQILREADFVTLHAPHTPETQHLITAERLSLMKPTAFLVNTARGALVDEAALYDALLGRRIAGAGMDVYQREPPTNSPLLTLDNVVLSPHSFANSLKAEAMMGDRCIRSVLAVSKGEELAAEYMVNSTVLQPRPM